MPPSDTSADRLDRIEAITERTASNIEALSHKVGLLTDQVGLLTEGLVEVRMNLREMSQTAERQEKNIDRLVGIVETLVKQPAKEASVHEG